MAGLVEGSIPSPVEGVLMRRSSKSSLALHARPWATDPVPLCAEAERVGVGKPIWYTSRGVLPPRPLAGLCHLSTVHC